MVGHHDRQGLRDDDASKSRECVASLARPGGGCSQEALRSTGGNGLFDCFAVNPLGHFLKRHRQLLDLSSSAGNSGTTAEQLGRDVPFGSPL